MLPFRRGLFGYSPWHVKYLLKRLEEVSAEAEAMRSDRMRELNERLATQREKVRHLEAQLASEQSEKQTLIALLAELGQRGEQILAREVRPQETQPLVAMAHRQALLGEHHELRRRLLQDLEERLLTAKQELERLAEAPTSSKASPAADDTAAAAAREAPPEVDGETRGTA